MIKWLEPNSTTAYSLVTIAQIWYFNIQLEGAMGIFKRLNPKSNKQKIQKKISEHNVKLYNCLFTTDPKLLLSTFIFSPKLYIQSTLNTDYLLWYTQLIVCAVNIKSRVNISTFQFFWVKKHSKLIENWGLKSRFLFCFTWCTG